MPKNLAAGMLTHINGLDQRLSLCVKIVRKFDRKLFAMTTAQKDLVFDGITYKAFPGFTPSSIRTSSDFTVDTAEITGITSDNPGCISLDEVRAGFFLGADVEYFMVDRSNLGNLSIKLRKGVLGNTQVIGNSGFLFELRGLTNFYQVGTGLLTSPTCVVDLFSSPCALDAFLFTQFGRVTAVTNRAQFTVANTDSGTNVLNTLTNDGAETGNTSGWTTVAGTFASSTAQFLFGARSFRVSGSGGLAFQEVDLVAEGVAGADIDAGLVGNYIILAGRTEGATNQKGKVYVEYSVTSGGPAIYQSSLAPYDLDRNAWQRILLNIAVPPTARFARIYLGNVGAGIAYYDGISFNFVYGNTLNFTRPVGDMTLDPDYFGNGYIQMISGNNAFFAREVKTLPNDTFLCSVFEGFPFDVAVGDVFLILPGCRKRYQLDCIAKFGNKDNFRAIPFLPGRDKFLDRPNAQVT